MLSKLTRSVSYRVRDEYDTTYFETRGEAEAWMRKVTTGPGGFPSDWACLDEVVATTIATANRSSRVGKKWTIPKTKDRLGGQLPVGGGFGSGRGGVNR